MYPLVSTKECDSNDIPQEVRVIVNAAALSVEGGTATRFGVEGMPWDTAGHPALVAGDYLVVLTGKEYQVFRAIIEGIAIEVVALHEALRCDGAIALMSFAPAAA